MHGLRYRYHQRVFSTPNNYETLNRDRDETYRKQLQIVFLYALMENEINIVNMPDKISLCYFERTLQ